MFKLVKNNSSKLIFFRYEIANKNQIRNIYSLNKLRQNFNHFKMLPINKLTISKPRNECTEPKGNIDEIRSTYKKFLELGNDIEIKVPWGKIAGKEFGKKGGLPILMIHGWLDNLNSWSLMIPNLLEKIQDAHIVAIDEPGCGFSDPKPKGCYYDVLGTVIEMRRVIKHMGWDKVTLIGHSKGSFNCYMYASFFPNEVRQIISCDLIGPDINFERDTSENIDKRIEMDNLFVRDTEGQTYTKVYTKQSALERLLKSRPIFNLSWINGELLLDRGLKPYKDGYTFSRDIQWNLFAVAVYPSKETVLQYLDSLDCDILNLIADDSPFKVDISYWDIYRDLYKKKCKLYREEMIEGGHYIHMDCAKSLSEKIVKFINDSSKIRLENKL